MTTAIADEVVADEVVADEVAVDEDVTEDAVDAADEVVADEVASGVEAGEYPGSALPDEDGNAPEGFEIKGNAQSMLYHTPDSRYYKATKAEVYFDTVESAEAAGFTAPGSSAGDDQEDEK